MSDWKSGVAKWPLPTVAGLIAFSVFGAWLGMREPALNGPRDFEECAEQIQNAPSAEHNALMTACNVRFAGRRKADGGYTYYDFMQNRHFDIAGPNPSAEERKYIDSEYMRFLDFVRRDALSAELAQRESEKLVASLDRLPTLGAPMILLPKSPPAKQPIINRIKQCRMEGSLSCGWAKLKSAVRDAFASAIKPGSG